MKRITINNYKSETKDIDFSKAHENLELSHNEFSEISSFYKTNSIVKEALDLLFEKVGEYILMRVSQQKKDTSSLKKRKKTQTSSKKTEMKYNHSALECEVRKASPSSKQFIVWDIAKKAIFSNEKFNSKNEAEDFIRSNKMKVIRNNEAAEKENPVLVIPLEIRFIKRYLNMANKRVNERQVGLFYKSIQKAAVEKLVRKTSKHASIIMKICKDLQVTYQDMDKTTVFKIPQNLQKEIEEIAKSYIVSTSVQLIKRFINLYGTITTDKANRLLKSIKSAKKQGKVTSKDDYYSRVNEIEAHLNDYVKSDKLIITQVQLNGLADIAGVGK